MVTSKRTIRPDLEALFGKIQPPQPVKRPRGRPGKSSAEARGGQVAPSPRMGSQKAKIPSAGSVEEFLAEAELAALLGCSDRQIRYLLSDGVLQKSPNGLYDTRMCIHAYCTRLVGIAAKRKDDNLTAAKLRETTARADKVELENARKRGELVAASEVEREWSNLLRDVRARMLSVPSRVAQRHGSMRQHDVELIDREIRDALTEAGNTHVDDA